VRKQQIPAPQKKQPAVGGPVVTPQSQGAFNPLDSLRRAPPWMVSMVVHAALLIVLALVTVPEVIRQTLVVESSQSRAEADIDDIEIFAPLEPQPATFEPVAVTPEVLPVVDDAPPPQFAAPPQFNADLPAPNVDPVTTALSGRSEGRRRAMLMLNGGNRASERAVRMGLHWLSKQQQEDGGWSLRGPYADGGNIENRVAATSMALLAFLGAGSTHQSGDYRETVARGWQILRKWQQADGDFFQRGPPDDHHLYTHAQAAIVACELYALTRDDAVKPHAEKAVEFALDAQSSAGGWRYRPRNDADTSVTGWFVMALQSAKMAGLKVPPAKLTAIMRYLDSVQEEKGARYRYQPFQDVSPAMTAEGLLCRLYLGWNRNDPRVQAGIAYVNDNPVDWETPNVYYWYYATQTAYHTGGEAWTSWNLNMRPQIIGKQDIKAPLTGSWSPRGDRYGAHGGRLFSTCMCLFMLEVYYRHLPIYKYRQPG